MAYRPTREEIGSILKALFESTQPGVALQLEHLDYPQIRLEHAKVLLVAKDLNYEISCRIDRPKGELWLVKKTAISSEEPCT